MRPPLDGTILVTGASSGIGRELARRLSATAGTLILVARRRDRLEALASELRVARPALPVHVIAADLGVRSGQDQVLAQAERLAGPIDVLVNNAGFGDIGVFDRASLPKLESMIALNVTALVYLTHRLLPGMLARRRGAVLNVSSGFGLQFMPGFAAYVGTKHFVTGFSDALHIEAATRGVLVSQLCPGPIDTEFLAVAGERSGLTAVPRFLMMSVERCARLALRDFARGRALIVPGIALKILLVLGKLAPRFALRMMYRPAAARLRAHQDRRAEVASMASDGGPSHSID